MSWVWASASTQLTLLRPVPQVEAQPEPIAKYNKGESMRLPRMSLVSKQECVEFVRLMRISDSVVDPDSETREVQEQIVSFALLVEKYDIMGVDIYGYCEYYGIMV